MNCQLTEKISLWIASLWKRAPIKSCRRTFNVFWSECLRSIPSPLQTVPVRSKEKMIDGDADVRHKSANGVIKIIFAFFIRYFVYLYRVV